MSVDETLSIQGADAYVGYEMTWALESYVMGTYGPAVLFCGLAVEEQLSLIYDSTTKKNPTKKYVVKAGPKSIRLETDDMDFAKLIDWARRVGLVDSSWGADDAVLDEIRNARNYFAHANRVIASKIRKKLLAGSFKLLLPSRKIAFIGDLDSQEFARNTIRYTGSILGRLR